jgi:hypothetical protein
MPRIYKIYDPDNADWPVKFRKKQSDAGECVKSVSDPSARTSIQVDLLDVKADLDNLLLALNGQHDKMLVSEPIKSWRGTPRGGLRDMSAPEPVKKGEPSPEQYATGETAEEFWARVNAESNKKK